MGTPSLLCSFEITIVLDSRTRKEIDNRFRQQGGGRTHIYDGNDCECKCELTGRSMWTAGMYDGHSKVVTNPDKVKAKGVIVPDGRLPGHHENSLHGILQSTKYIDAGDEDKHEMIGKFKKDNRITEHHDKHIDEIISQHHSLDDKQVKGLHEFLEQHKQRLEQDQDSGTILAEFKKTSGIQSSNKDGHIQKIIEEYKVQLKA